MKEDILQLYNEICFTDEVDTYEDFDLQEMVSTGNMVTSSWVDTLGLLHPGRLHRCCLLFGREKMNAKFDENIYSVYISGSISKRGEEKARPYLKRYKPSSMR